jgi:acyl-CoA synthetase (AMP-forming)/AMP-acid ligase II
MLRQRAAQSGDHAALIDGDARWTYATLLQRVREAGDWLHAQGIRAGDRVMLVCENGRAAVALYFGILETGAWPIVVSARIAERELAEIRAHSGARRVLYTVAAAPRARAHAVRDGATIVDIDGVGPIGLGPLETETEAEIEPGSAAERIAALVYTSGTTGTPKGVLLTHRNLLFVASTSGVVRRLSADDRVYAVLPISHILGLTGVSIAALMFGATLQLVPRFDPAALLRALSEDGVSFVLGTPAMYALFTEYAGRNGLGRIEQPRLRLISTAGAPLDMATKQATERLFGRPLYNGYGITECGPTVSLTPLDAPRDDLSVGALLPGIEARLAGTDGEIGELWLRGPGVMKGYYKAPDETRAVLDDDGWFNTRDLARLEDDSLFKDGRTKELIIRFGFNVYPAEIEAVLNGHPAVAQSAVVSRPGANEVEIVAFVQPVGGSGVEPADLLRYAAERLAVYKQPSEVVLLEVLPATPAGKILKQELVALARG